MLFAGYQKAVAEIYDTTFENNTSIQGGVFQIEFESVVKLYNCNLVNNFAVEAGVVRVNKDGHFEFTNVVIRENNAISMSVAELFDTATPSICND